jgi:hypothetical protein
MACMHRQRCWRRVSIFRHAVTQCEWLRFLEHCWQH